MNEADTRADLIEPALKAAGWGVAAESMVRREEIAPGRILTNGRRGKAKWVDFILYHRGRKLAVVEAKARGKGAGAGVAQAKDYAHRLGVRFAYATDGVELYQIDMETGAESPCDSWPSPDTLWDRTFAETNAWREAFAKIPFETKGGQWQPRYYQDAAINAALDAIARGDRRILLTLATGTGKTAIAFQIAWKLFHAKWNLTGAPTRRPRILFLADRNILANQAYNAFSAFEEDARVRIKPDEIRKTGAVPKNASVFFTIFQTFMSGESEEEEEVEDSSSPVHGGGPGAPGAGEGASTDVFTHAPSAEDSAESAYYTQYPADFFDMIVIDECHRGGANDESSWRAIMEHFSPAVQLGLTATPKRTDNVDTYKWFGEPVYTYALKDGIEDGFLTPFRVVDFSTTIDDYVHTEDNVIVTGMAQAGERFEAKDFNRTIEIRDREEAMVRLLLTYMDQSQKALIFCASQNHAATIRDLINQHSDHDSPFYAIRVTADDGAYGEQQLKNFQDNEKTIPTVLTTSHKLSTGVDAHNVRSIVLMRPVKNMIEFKQIIGRGTRTYEGKTYFTIFDFYKNSYQFSDPAWDGEPEEVIGGENGPKTPPNLPETGPKPPSERPETTRIKLSDGSIRRIKHMASTMFWGSDGKPITPEAFLQQLFGDIPSFFADEDALRRIWGDPETREKLLKDLDNAGYDSEKLGEVARLIEAEDSDLFDVLAHIAYRHEPKSRKQRVKSHRDAILERQSGDKQRQFIDFVLAQYEAEGVEVLSKNRLSRLLSLKYGDMGSGVRALGGDADAVRRAFLGFQPGLYR